MPQLSLSRLAPQRLLNSIVAALLLLTAPTISHGSPTPASQAVLALEDSATALQLAAQLPLTARFHDRMGTAVFAQLPTPLAVTDADPLRAYRAGDIAYVTAEQNIVVFLTDGSAVPDHGVVLLGHLDRGLDDLAGCRNDCPVELVSESARRNTTG